jgi:hypothetical protein
MHIPPPHSQSLVRCNEEWTTLHPSPLEISPRNPHHKALRRVRQPWVSTIRAMPAARVVRSEIEYSAPISSCATVPPTTGNVHFNIHFCVFISLSGYDYARGAVRFPLPTVADSPVTPQGSTAQRSVCTRYRFSLRGHPGSLCRVSDAY